MATSTSTRVQGTAGPEPRPGEPQLVSIIIPTYREYGLGQALDQLVSHLRDLEPTTFEILVVDDSDDATQAELEADLARRRTALPPGVALELVRGPRRGKGAAVRLGGRRSKGGVVFLVDADLPVPLTYIEDFIDTMHRTSADVIIGERPRDRYAGNLLRGTVARGLRLIQKTLVFHGALFEDTQCGFKAFRGDVLRSIADRQIVDGGMYDLEYLYAATRRHLDVQRRGVSLNPEVRPSRINVWKCVFFDPLDILRFKVAGIAGRYRAP
jgi:glycosyltransferase involved in cell wall biosynthesis